MAYNFAKGVVKRICFQILCKSLKKIPPLFTAARVSILRAFDVELLYIAQKLKIALGEVAINWTEIEGLYHAKNIKLFVLKKAFL